LLLLGAYRDVEVAPHHPLTEALATLPREPSYELLALRGLDAAAVPSLGGAGPKRPVPPAWAEALTRETNGNPFFLRELLLDLVEEGALGHEGRERTAGGGKGAAARYSAAGDRAAPRTFSGGRARAVAGGGGVHGRDRLRGGAACGGTGRAAGAGRARCRAGGATVGTGGRLGDGVRLHP